MDGVGCSNVAAGTEKVGTYWHGPEGAVALLCGRGKQSFPVAGRRGSE